LLFDKDDLAETFLAKPVTEFAAAGTPGRKEKIKNSIERFPGHVPTIDSHGLRRGTIF